MKTPDAPVPTAREIAASALARSARQFPQVGPSSLDLGILTDRRQRQLAVAIHRTALQRWITLEFLLNRFTNQPLGAMEPRMRGVLISGAAQLLFMDRLPAYAVIDESVSLARHMIRPKASGMVNAVLRKVSGLVQRVEQDQPWYPARDRLPMGNGTVVLAEPCLPDPDDLEGHLAAAVSAPVYLVRRWRKRFGDRQTIALALHGIRMPPTVVAVETGFDLQMSVRRDSEDWVPHEQPGFAVWTGPHDRLARFLAGHGHRRVQDPGVAEATAACGGLEVRTILDYCAGLGTKTRQLAAMHPQAQIVATDVKADRRHVLEAVERSLSTVKVMGPESIGHRCFDLVVLDVPCTNSAVLARRPEARFRLSPATLKRMVKHQQQIITEALPRVRSGGWVLYLTCSLEEQENDQQARWILSCTGGRLEAEQTKIPGGSGTEYHDGGYYALIRLL